MFLLAHSVVEDFNIFRYLLPCLRSTDESAMVHKFILEQAPETFHWGAVPAVPLPTHGSGHTELVENLLVVISEILVPRSEW